jgi:hypothetical protein
LPHRPRNHGHPEVALPRGEDDLTAAHDPPLAQRFQQRELPIVQLRKGDALRVAVELVVFLGVGHDMCASSIHIRIEA